VYHSDDDQVKRKKWASLYHDRVGDAVRQANRIHARCRMHGLCPPREGMWKTAGRCDEACACRR
jgi:hypothetical protein